MRKVMFLALLAASVAAPSAAMAQRGEGGWRSRDEARPARAERVQQRQENRVERQQNRQENRSERQEARQENRGERQQARQARQQQPRQQQPAVAQQQRQDRPTRSGWMGNPNDARMEAHRERYERLDRQNARRNGTQEQYRSVVEQQGSQRQARREDRREDRQDWRNGRRDNRQDWRNDRRNDRGNWRNDRRGDRGNWNRGWRNDNRYDWQRFRNSNRFVFRIQPYYSPYRGYGYNRFSIGNVLDRLFWGQNYWIQDPWTYRLPPAPYGYQWVRYYNDVVLVDTYNGEIVDVIYDFFW